MLPRPSNVQVHSLSCAHAAPRDLVGAVRVAADFSLRSAADEVAYTQIEQGEYSRARGMMGLRTRKLTVERKLRP